MRRCRDYARTYDHTVIEEGLDLDISGGVMSRPVLDRFLQEIKGGRAQGLIVAKLDRFSRSSRGALNALAEIEAAGGVLISVQEQIDSTTAAGRFVRSIFLATAEWERERIGESWLSAKASAVARGIHISRHVPPGYAKGDDRKLSPDPVYGPIVAEAFAMAAHGERYNRIAAYLTEKRLPIGGNGESVWESNRIKRLLENRVYLGEARNGHGDVNTGAHPPLVDALTWNLAQREPSGPTLSNPKSGTELLSGICRCASCSYAMRSQSARRSVVAAYRCRTNSPNGRCPHPSTISLERLEGYVLDQFLAHHADVTLTQSDGEEGFALAAAAAAEAERLYQETLRNSDLAAALGANDYAVTLASLKERWQAALAAVPVTPAKATATDVDIAGLVDELQRRGDTQSLRELLGSAIQAVFVRPAASRARNLPIEDRVHIVWADDQPLELPKRGTRFEPRAYTW
jgi:site-specific DNA recombinase